MAKVIVIGAGGQIGTDLVPRLHEQGDELVLVDRIPAEEAHTWETFNRYFSDRPEWTSWWRVLDATSEPADRQLISEVRPDVVYHMAAVLSARCEDDPLHCWLVNMSLFRNVLQDLHAVTTDDYRPKLVWPSSIAAFGPPPGSSGSFEAENDYPLMPTTMYGVTKVACELLGTYYAEKHGVDFRAVRFPGLLNTAPPGGGSSDYANAMYFGGADGTNSAVSFVRPETRIPFMFMEDAVTAMLQLAAADESRLSRRVYNIRAFPAPSAAEIAASVAAEVPGFTVRYEPDQRQKNVDAWPSDFDDSLARRDWDWQPRVADLRTMTRRLLADIRAQREAAPA